MLETAQIIQDSYNRCLADDRFFDKFYDIFRRNPCSLVVKYSISRLRHHHLELERRPKCNDHAITEYQTAHRSRADTPDHQQWVCVMGGVGYSEVEFPLQSGDVLVFMTDGIIEAHDAEGREYQESGRLQKVLVRFTLEMSADAMVEAVIDDVAAFSGETAEQEDDITVVVVKAL